MKTLASRMSGLLQGTRKKWRQFKLRVGKAAVGIDHWLNAAEQIRRISSCDIRVAGATLRKLPPAAAAQKQGTVPPVRLNLNVLKALRQDR
ncbi:MAG: hypothetical protein ACRESO_06855, partial [Gammaproteobacteria bacterium]